MAVVLVGVGAESEHLRPKLQLTEEGYFDYIPIPESYPTSETLTYGTFDLDHRGGTAASYVTALSLKGGDSDWIDDPAEIESHPVHHDPNFETMTFGDRQISDVAVEPEIVRWYDDREIIYLEPELSEDGVSVTIPEIQEWGVRADY